MKSKRLFSLLGVIVLILIFLVGTLITAYAKPPAAKVELSVISPSPKVALKAKLLQKYCDKVNEASNGEINVKILGGPEVVPPPEQAGAVNRGVVDMAMLPPSFLAGSVPVGDVTKLTLITQEEEIKRGIIDNLQPYYAKGNYYCLGEIFGSNEPVFMLFTAGKKIEKLSDLKGLTIGASNVVLKPVADALGFGIKTIPISEIYVALERKLVDGWHAPAGPLLTWSVQEVIDYAIDHPVFPDVLVIVMNLDKWKSLSKTHQNVLRDTLINISPELGRLNYEDELKARSIFKGAGVQFIKFSSEDDAKKYVKTFYDEQWKQYAKYPEFVTQFKQLLSP
jgi:TRAP-type C4-dicarboxylate transport system substrate-binding protein